MSDFILVFLLTFDTQIFVNRTQHNIYQIVKFKGVAFNHLLFSPLA